MAALKFASSHNMVAFLDKPTESDGFEQIVDFLNAHPIKYALTVNPTIYTSCIEQFWTTAKVKTVNGEVQIQALVDKKKVIITETSIRSDLQLEDAEAYFFNPKVLDLEEAKTAQAKEIASLKKRVKQLEQRRKSRTSGLKRRMIQQRRKNDADLDADAEVTLIDETQERNDEEMLFDVQDDLQGEEVVAKKEVVAEKEVSAADLVTTVGDVVTTANVKVTTASASTTTISELTLAQTLIEIKAAKPKVVTTAATTTTTTRPKAKGVVVQEPSEFKTTSSPLQASQLPQA
ncbi:hypothetical protein Tco_0691786 [Tanacetum coccineum]